MKRRLVKILGKLAVAFYNCAARLSSYDIKSFTNITINIDKINPDSVDVTVISESEIRNFSDIVEGKSEAPDCRPCRLIEGSQLRVSSRVNFDS